MFITCELRGAGRRKIMPACEGYRLPAQAPETLSLARIRKIIQCLKSTGSFAEPLPYRCVWCVEEWCQVSGVPYSFEYDNHRIVVSVCLTSGKTETQPGQRGSLS